MMRRVFWFLVALAVVLAGVVVLAVFPARTYLEQRRQLAAAEERLEVLTDQNRRLASRVQELGTDDEIERLAREQYNLVRPGEEAYAILPVPTTAPPPAPPVAEEDSGSLWSRVLDTVTFWN